MKRRSRCLDDWLPVVFVSFALLCGATLWHEASQPAQLATAQTA